MTRQNNYDPNKYSNRKPYNGIPVPDGEVLAPVWFTDEILQTGGDSIILDNLTIWEFGGYHFKIGFAPIRAESYERYMNGYFLPELNAAVEKQRPFDAS